MKTLFFERVIIANKLIKRFMGYMFRNEPASAEVLIITPCNQIHTFHMKFPIDVLYLNKDDVVVHMEKDIKPWKIRPKISSAHYVIEGKRGSFKGVEVGMRIEIQIK